MNSMLQREDYKYSALSQISLVIGKEIGMNENSMCILLYYIKITTLN